MLIINFAKNVQKFLFYLPAYLLNLLSFLLAYLLHLLRLWLHLK